MITLPVATRMPAFFLKRESPEIIPVVNSKPADREQSEERDAVLCGNCRQPITSTSERMTVQGAHQHTFANPQGILFEIACFRHASGCRYSGLPTSEWSWFRGFSWRFASCGKCMLQLGWFFSSGNENGFNGLIVNRLIFPG
ncbi:MAG: cereblon family protein [Thermodesulfobacteriota bacterium]